MSRARGYILVEAVTAMAVLSITAVAVQRAVHTAVLARGLARDYTTAQFLLERVAADQALQPRIAAGETYEGIFPPPDDRFSYRWYVENVDIAMDETLPEPPTGQRVNLLRSMGRMHIEVSWNRGGQPFLAEAETLLSPDRVWVDPQAPLP